MTNYSRVRVHAPAEYSYCDADSGANAAPVHTPDIQDVKLLS